MPPDQLRTLAARVHTEARDDEDPVAADFGRRLADLFELASTITTERPTRADREDLLAAAGLLAQATAALYEPEEADHA